MSVAAGRGDRRLLARPDLGLEDAASTGEQRQAGDAREDRERTVRHGLVESVSTPAQVVWNIRHELPKVAQKSTPTLASSTGAVAR